MLVSVSIRMESCVVEYEWAQRHNQSSGGPAQHSMHIRLQIDYQLENSNSDGRWNVK
jgi:hypothetical protein